MVDRLRDRWLVMISRSHIKAEMHLVSLELVTNPGLVRESLIWPANKIEGLFKLSVIQVDLAYSQ